MKRIYLDNGATSFPKAPGVAKAINNYILNIGTSVGRGAYAEAFETEGIVYDTRELLADMFGAEDSKNVIFTKNITESLNVLLHGFLKKGDHVIVSSLEHNAMMRPLVEMEALGVTFTRVTPNTDGVFDQEDLEKALEPGTKLIAMMHASNVFGTLLDLEPVGEFAKAHNLRFIVDAAQTAGFAPVNMKTLNADAIAFTGHKSLLGPQGIGGFVITDDFADQVNSFIQGGTGSRSDSEKQPRYLPDKFESGTPNTVGIIGLHAALTFIKDKGMDEIRAHEMHLTKILMDGLKQNTNIQVIGSSNIDRRTAVVSFDTPNHDSAMVSHTLTSKYGINNRCGMHCAPSAHKTMGTFPQGTIRLSLGFTTTLEDVQSAIDALEEILSDDGNFA
ncbi:aminotransferase class V-fold PLP-dependent enzyme [Fusibacter sp. JL216-2]|uniref:aminotransferase class V-fold PLP-dependent enzyme n=1 Tax=Fusibacter sp. JL216-2 TaxID=3071453 RepID=UPI003D33EE01